MSGEKVGETNSGELGVGAERLERSDAQETGARILAAMNRETRYGEGLTLEEDKAFSQRMRKEVFEEVDQEAMVETLRPFVEKMRGKDLLRLQREIDKDLKTGVQKTEAYFVNILGLQWKPPVVRFVDMPEGVNGECGYRGVDIPDDMRICSDGGPDVLVTLAHENLHSWQHQEMDDAMGRAMDDPGVIDERGTLYAYNFRNYIKSEDDIVGYTKQLTELEAFWFAERVGELRATAEAEDAWWQFEKVGLEQAHPEIYDDVVEDVVAAEVAKVLDGFDVEKFVQSAGLKDITEIDEASSEEQYWEVGTGVLRAMAETIGLGDDWKVDFVDELPNEQRAKIVYSGHEIVVSEKGKRELAINELQELLWRARQREMTNDPDSEMGKLYKYNMDNFVKEDADQELYERQLVMNEAKTFVSELNDILNEQMMMGELGKLPPEERERELQKMRDNGWGFEKSEKYHVKGKRL